MTKRGLNMNELSGTNTTDIVKIKPKKDIRKYRTTGFYKDIDIKMIDGRTKAGKAIAGLRRELQEYVGQGSIAADLLIGQICYKVLKLTLYQTSSLKDLQNEEAAHFLPMANSLRLDLVALKDMAGKAKALDLGSYIETHYGKDNKK